MLIKLSACGARRGVWNFLFADRPVATVFSCLFLAAGVGLMPEEAIAASGVQVVQYDMGGDVDQRIREVAQLRAQGTEVRIEGTCVSACTLYLGLPNSCVTTNATLGFHGPRTSIPGIPLPREDFERISSTMATYYPGRIRTWFMSKARLITENYYTISGAQAVAMGAHRCT